MVESMVESVPQSILQMIAMVIHNTANPISVFSVRFAAACSSLA